MERNNEVWLTHLRSCGPEREKALNDLRRILLRGLGKVLSGHPRVDDAFLQDAVQDSLLRVLDRLSQFQGRSRFVTWAMSVAIRVAMDELRRRHWKDVSLEEVVAGPALVAGDREPAPSLEQRAIVGKMYEIIRRSLTAKQQMALLAELRGMPQSEIARQLGSNRNALYKLTHDARKRLKRGLEDAGYRRGDVDSAFLE